MDDIKNKYNAALERIMAAKNVLLVTHERPDGDGLSAVCALSLFLEKSGKSWSAFCADPAPESLNFIPNINKIKPSAADAFESFDLIIVCDCGCLARTGLAEKISGRAQAQAVIEFDHHLKVDDYADIEIRLSGLSSACEVIYHFFAKNNLVISKPIADCLLIGILTDTGNLLFSSVTEETVRIASALLLYGATLPRLVKKTSQNKSLAEMKVWGKVLDNLRLNEKYNVAYSALTFSEVEELRGEFGDQDLFSSATDVLNNIDAVKAVVFLREEQPGQIRGSLRTKDPFVDVARLAEKLGGGGHTKAAAFRLAGHIVKTETGWKII